MDCSPGSSMGFRVRVFTLKERRNCINKCDLIECSGPFLLLWSSLLCHEPDRNFTERTKRSSVPIRRNANAILARFLALLISHCCLFCLQSFHSVVDSFQLEFSSTQLYVFRERWIWTREWGSYCTGLTINLKRKGWSSEESSESASHWHLQSPFTMKDCKAVSLLFFLRYA